MASAYTSGNLECASTGPPRSTSWRKTVLAAAGTLLCIGSGLVMYQGATSVSSVAEGPFVPSARTLLAESDAVSAEYVAPDMLMPGKPIMIRVRGKANLCMDDGGGATSGATDITLQPCNPLDPNQVFMYDASTFQLKSVAKDGLCVDVFAGATPGQNPAHMWACNPANANQIIHMDPETEMISNPASGWCLDDGNADTAAQKKFTLWTCSTTNRNQRFQVLSQEKLEAELYTKIDKVLSGEKFILRINGKKNLCLDDGNGKTAASSKFLRWDCNPSNPNQVFWFDTETNRVRSYSKKGLCLDDGGGTSSGQTQFVLWYCDVNNKNQDFEYDPETQMITNPNKPGLCMDDGGGLSRGGSQRFHLWTCNRYNRNQHFALDPIKLDPGMCESSAQLTLSRLIE